MKNNANTRLKKFFKEYMAEIKEGAIDARAAREVGKEVVKEMKAQIAKGISPIEGRFPGYKGAGKPNKYPASVKRYYPTKRPRPVNLTLTGKFLRDLQARFKSLANGNKVVEIGYFKESEVLKELGHREGANGQPNRPTIPEDAESFNAKIEKIILQIAKEAVEKFLKRKG